jgi:hypothetical protein
VEWIAVRFVTRGALYLIPVSRSSFPTLLPTQRRGLATTAKPSKEQVKKQVNKAGAQIARQMQSQSQTSTGGRRRKGANAGGNGNNGRPASAPAAVPAGLKISFKPAELNKTTEKSVALQVMQLDCDCSLFIIPSARFVRCARLKSCSS